MATSFEKLIKRYAGNKVICNCKQAYYEDCGKGYVNGKHRTDLPICRHGCSANQIVAKEHVAAMVLGEEV